MSWCPSCGNEVSEGWRFCRSCGARLAADTAGTAEGASPAATQPVPRPPEEGAEGASAAAPTQPIPRAPEADETAASTAVAAQTAPPRRRRWLRVTAAALGILALVGAGSAGAWVHLETREELRATQGELRRTKDDLAATSEDLRIARAQLEVAREENRRLERELRELRVELRGVRGTLSEAQARLELQAGQIEDLKECLNGVSLALDNVLYGDYWAAANALTAVQTSCEAAFALF